MNLTEDIYKLKGKIMHYAWGGDAFIPDFLGIDNPDHQPFAEYWMGAHPLASSELLTKEGHLSLYMLIKENPSQMISEPVFTRFGELPY